MDIADTILFRVVCDIMAKIQCVKGMRKKANVISQYYESFCNHRLRIREHDQINKEDPENGRNSFYCVLRCLIPRCDRARPPYRLQITALGAAYIKILQLGEQSYDADVLAGRKTYWDKCDYAQNVYKVLKPRCQQGHSKISIKKIHNLLNVISDGDHTDTEKVLTFLSENCSAYEQMWFVRLVLKSMCLGIGEQQILNALHPQAKDFLLSCNNLSLLCCKLADNELDIDDKDSKDDNPVGAQEQLYIIPFEHVSPQLCEKFPGRIDTLMAEDVLFMETKMDGERFHIHFYKEHFRYLSRNGCDYTDSFGATSSDSNTLSSKLKPLLPVDMQSIILDGEMMIWDTKHKTFHEKSENTDVKHLRPSGNWQPCFVVYDLLYFNDYHMIKLPYIQRMQKMRSLLKEEEGVLHIMKTEKIVSVEQFQDLFQKALDSQQEGVVLKKRNALYRPGRRNGSGWYKFKADYFDGLTTEFDLLVMGGFYDRQRRFIESFLLGVLDKNDDQVEVWSVGKVNNITCKRQILNEMLKIHWHSMVDDPPPSMWYHYVSNNAEGRPDVWIEPNHSVILQIRATDLNPSSAFALNTGLHFPRIVHWRNDKLWHECLSLQEYNEILKQSSGGIVKKINKRCVTTSELQDSIKRQKLTPAQKRRLALDSYECKFNASNVKKLTDYLEGYKVCILSGNQENGHTIDYLKNLVVENGGEVVENPLPNNPKCISVAGEMTFRVRSICKSGKYDIASVDWLIRFCKNPNTRHPIRPMDMLAVTPLLQKFLAESFDKYGDHYTDLATLAELTEIMNNIPKEELKTDINNDLAIKLESKIYGCNKSPYFYRNKIAHFYNFNLKMWKALKVFCSRGGKTIDNLIKTNAKTPVSLDYIFMEPYNFDSDKLNKWIKDSIFPITYSHIVNIEWILDCHIRNCILDMNDYIFNDF